MSETIPQVRIFEDALFEPLVELRVDNAQLKRRRRTWILLAFHFYRMEYADFANFFHPANKNRSLRTMLEQKIRQRIYVHRSTKKRSRESTRNT